MTEDEVREKTRSKIIQSFNKECKECSEQRNDTT